MRTNSTVSFNKPTRSIANDQSAVSSKAFSPKEAKLATKTVTNETSPLNKEVLLSLAADFKNGLIDKEQANERFVSAVIDGSVSGSLSKNVREAMTKDIANFFADDPEFMNKLQKNLRDLS